ncbi:MAG: hypothetical protein JXA99_03975 [Candidatus Lokiarchaeota archaeon]|nr:hypothetical protein [Candidatus Lokiarchaeota archaeon]
MRKSKNNSLGYFYAYFAIQIIFILVHSYLPIYFKNIIFVDQKTLIYAWIISYSFLLIKPLISLYYNKRTGNFHSILIVSSISIVISFFLMILTLELLMIFGFFLGINFAFSSILDVIVDKSLVEKSNTEKKKNKNATSLQLGAAFGSLIPPFFYLITPNWSIFFVSLFIMTIPLVFIVYFMNMSVQIQKKEEEEIKSVKISSNKIILMCIFTFLIYADKLYEIPLEPWITTIIDVDLFSILLIILIVINTLGIIMAGLISHKYNKKKILMICCFGIGILSMISSFSNIFIFFIMFSIMQILAGFILINLISLMIDISNKQVLYYQIIAFFAILAKLIFVPLGDYLSIYIPVELIIFISGVPFIVSSIILYYI